MGTVSLGYVINGAIVFKLVWFFLFASFMQDQIYVGLDYNQISLW